MASERSYEVLTETIHVLAEFYKGTPLSEFKNMPLAEIKVAVENMERIAKIREKAMKR